MKATAQIRAAQERLAYVASRMSRARCGREACTLALLVEGGARALVP
jgi:hypothetical protein